MEAQLRKQFAAAVRARRQEIGWSQERLAEEANLHRTYVSGIECAKRNVSIDNIEKICEALSVEPADLLRSSDLGAI